MIHIQRQFNAKTNVIRWIVSVVFTYWWRNSVCETECCLSCEKEQSVLRALFLYRHVKTMLFIVQHSFSGSEHSDFYDRFKSKIDHCQKKVDILIDRWLIFYLCIILFLLSSPVESNSNLKKLSRPSDRRRQNYGIMQAKKKWKNRSYKNEKIGFEKSTFKDWSIDHDQKLIFDPNHYINFGIERCRIYSSFREYRCCMCFVHPCSPTSIRRYSRLTGISHLDLNRMSRIFYTIQHTELVPLSFNSIWTTVHEFVPYISVRWRRVVPCARARTL